MPNSRGCLLITDAVLESFNSGVDEPFEPVGFTSNLNIGI